MNLWVGGLGMLLAAGGLLVLGCAARDLRTFNPLVLLGLAGSTPSTPESPAQDQGAIVTVATDTTNADNTNDTAAEIEAAGANLPEEPGEFGIVSFTNVSPSTNVRKAYVGIKTPIGWQVTGGGRSERVPRRASWLQIVAAAEEGTLLVHGELTVTQPDPSTIVSDPVSDPAGSDDPVAEDDDEGADDL